uniref:E3 ubiquitin-protein ligase n=1 Tax=Ascaris lumbricoides TaxID=6252 RepID=A0A0M3IXS9_ASCLU
MNFHASRKSVLELEYVGEEGTGLGPTLEFYALVPRNGEQLFEYANRVMNFHASRKSVLELEYVGEEGTGLGPTLEFYALTIFSFRKSYIEDEEMRQQKIGNGHG